MYQMGDWNIFIGYKEHAETSENMMKMKKKKKHKEFSMDRYNQDEVTLSHSLLFVLICARIYTAKKLQQQHKQTNKQTRKFICKKKKKRNIEFVMLHGGRELLLKEKNASKQT